MNGSGGGVDGCWKTVITSEFEIFMMILDSVEDMYYGECMCV